MDEMLFVLLAAGVAIFGVIFGAQVQKMCRFIVPTDFITFSMTATIIVNAIVNIVPIDLFWYAPFLLGYFTGYLVVGRTTYTMCIEMPDPNHIRVCNRVFFEDSGKMYVQEQKNGALFDRLVFRVKNEVVTNAPIDDDKVLSYDRPLFPKWEDRAIMIEKVYTTVEEKEGRIFKHKTYTTHIDVAYGSCTPKFQLMYDIDVLDKMQKQVIGLTAEVHRLQSETGSKMLEHAMQLDMAAKRTMPANRALDLAKRFNECKANIPTVKKEETENA